MLLEIPTDTIDTIREHMFWLNIGYVFVVCQQVRSAHRVRVCLGHLLTDMRMAEYGFYSKQRGKSMIRQQGIYHLGHI